MFCLKLHTKVFAIFTIIAILPLLVLTYFAYSRYVKSVHQHMDEISSHLFENAQESINSSLNTIRQAAGMFTLYPGSGFSVIDLLEPFSDPEEGYDAYKVLEANQELKFMCQSVFYTYNYINSIYIITPSGAILGHSIGKNGDIRLNYDPSNEEWYGQTLALDGKIYVSDLAVHDMFSGEKSSVFFSQRLKDIYTHEFLGVLVIDCDPAVFDLNLINTMPDITLLTLDNRDTGSVLYSNFSDFGGNFPQKNTTVMQEPLNMNPLQLTAVFDYDALFREFKMTGIVLLLIGAACVVGIILLAYVVSHNLVHPIEHLSRKMASQRGHKLLVSGRYLNRTDEIGTLYNEYNSMVEELNSSIKRDYHDKLIVLDAQMKSLEARINPHFLFNTLESINSMAELADNQQIATMSQALGNMFRYAIKTESELVSVQDELSHVLDYSSIQQIRFQDRFKLVVVMDDAFRQEKVLKLILQPLVENALYHGLGHCTKGDTITISGHVENNNLLICVKDNGQGIDEDQLAQIRERLQEEASFTELGRRTGHSIGLKNIHSRLELYYGRGYGLTVSSRLGEWTEVWIKVPAIGKEELL